MFHLVTIPPRVMHGQEHARCCAALLNAQPMGFYAPAQIVRDACDHGVDTSSYNWCKIAQIAATENSDPHVDPYMSCEKVPGFNLEYKLGPDGDSPEHRSNPAWTSPQQVAVQRDREERDEEDPSEVALRVHDPDRCLGRAKRAGVAARWRPRPVS